MIIFVNPKHINLNQDTMQQEENTNRNRDVRRLANCYGRAGIGALFMTILLTIIGLDDNVVICSALGVLCGGLITPMFPKFWKL